MRVQCRAVSKQMAGANGITQNNLAALVAMKTKCCRKPTLGNMKMGQAHFPRPPRPSSANTPKCARLICSYQSLFITTLFVGAGALHKEASSWPLINRFTTALLLQIRLPLVKGRAGPGNTAINGANRPSSYLAKNYCVWETDCECGEYCNCR